MRRDRGSRAGGRGSCWWWGCAPWCWCWLGRSGGRGGRRRPGPDRRPIVAALAGVDGGRDGRDPAWRAGATARIAAIVADRRRRRDGRRSTDRAARARDGHRGGPTPAVRTRPWRHADHGVAHGRLRRLVPWRVDPTDPSPRRRRPTRPTRGPTHGRRSTRVRSPRPVAARRPAGPSDRDPPRPASGRRQQFEARKVRRLVRHIDAVVGAQALAAVLPVAVARDR